LRTRISTANLKRRVYMAGPTRNSKSTRIEDGKKPTGLLFKVGG